jgi:hypothetical protein
MLFAGVGIDIVIQLLVLHHKSKINFMKDFATAGIAALMMAGFYALGSATAHHTPKIEQSRIYTNGVTDTVPKRNDTLNKRMPKDTTTRKDTMQKNG